MPQDPESHWATRGVIAWLRVPRFAKHLAVSGAIALGVGTSLSAISIHAVRSYDRNSASGGTCVGAANTPGGADPWGGCFPGAQNTGVPSGTSLTTYTGGTTISTTATINAKTVNSRILVTSGGNLTVTNSQLMLGIDVEGTGILSMSDSYASSDDNAFKVVSGEGAGLTLLRNDIDGGEGNSGGWCLATCILTDNWIHNDTVLAPGSLSHMSGWRQRQGGTYTHNVFACNVVAVNDDGGCSAGLTGYGDFETVQNNTMDKNLFTANETQAFCAYGGSSAGKPFPNAHHIVFTNNIFQKGVGFTSGLGPCAAYGPISDFNPSGTGNAWTNNLYDDGTTVPST